MADTYGVQADSGGSGKTPQIIIRNEPPRQPWFGKTVTRVFLAMSVLANLALFGMYQQYYPNVSANEQFKEGDQFAEDKVAIIKVSGMIMTETVQSAIRELELATKDDSIKAVVLAVNSPGGTISGSDELYHALVKFREKTAKPLVVSMHGMATSGGYYVSAPADKIFADRSCMTGSIGVILSSVTVEKLLEDWGIEPRVIKSGNMKDSGSLFRGMTPEERERWQVMINKMFQQFLGVVTTHRGEKISEEQLRDLGGRVLLAEEALEMGLIDQIGYEEDALAEAKKLAGLGDKVRIVTYQRPLGGLMDLIGGHANPPGQGIAEQLSRLLQMSINQPLLLPEAMVANALAQ